MHGERPSGGRARTVPETRLPRRLPPRARFPDDASAWEAVGARLAAAGRYAIAPYVRGCGPTRFLSPAVPRSGQVTARARDVLQLMDALSIERGGLRRVLLDCGHFLQRERPDEVVRLLLEFFDER